MNPQIIDGEKCFVCEKVGRVTCFSDHMHCLDICETCLEKAYDNMKRKRTFDFLPSPKCETCGGTTSDHKDGCEYEKEMEESKIVIKYD